MYSYVKERKLSKKKLLISLSCLLIAGCGLISYRFYHQQQNKKDSAVFQEEILPVLALPDAQQKGVKPFSVDAQVVLDYYDGKESEINNITQFEGVYRGNQGIDYALNDQVFEVQAVFSGEVSDVRNDELFGNTVVIQSGDLIITYQSLDAIQVKKGEHIEQKQTIGTAGKNIYNKDLGNHVHIVTQVNGKLVDPETIYDKTLEELK